MIGVAAGVVMAGALAAMWRWWPSVPRPDAPRGELISFMASEQFGKMSEESQRTYLGAARDQFAAIYFDRTIPDEVKEKAFINVMESRWGKRLDEYYQLRPGKERTAYLDDVLRRMKRTEPTTRNIWTTLFTRKGGDGRSLPGGMASWMTPERQKRFVENSSPAFRAQMAEFMAELQNRREATGMK